MRAYEPGSLCSRSQRGLCAQRVAGDVVNGAQPRVGCGMPAQVECRKRCARQQQSCASELQAIFGHAQQRMPASCCNII